MPRSRFALLVLAISLLAISAAYRSRIGYAAVFTNSAPTANPDSYTLHGNGTIGSLCANDTDPDPGDTLRASLVTTPSNGSLGGIDGCSFGYTRNSSTWTGTDSFTYKARDNGSPQMFSSPVTVTITVTNQSPNAVNDIYNIHGQTAIGPSSPTIPIQMAIRSPTHS